MGLWEKAQELASRASSVFLPPYAVPTTPTAFEGDPERVRKERPLLISTQTRWLQSDILMATGSADQGFMAPVARLSRSIRRDGTSGGILATRTSGLCRLPKQFRGDERVIRAFEDHHEGSQDVAGGLFAKIFRSTELALYMGDRILNGVGIGRLVYLPDRAHPIFVRFDPEFLRYQWGDDRWYYDTIAGPLHVVPGDGSWMLFTNGLQTPWANGMWPALGRSFIAKEHAFNYRENYSGKLANPARAAVSPLGATEPQRRGMLSKLIAWGINTTFDLPVGWDVKLIELKGEGFKVFQDTIDASDKEFMIMLAGQIVTITGGAGFANADIHATIRSDLIQDDGDGLAENLNEQAFPHIVNRLFGGGARCSVKWDTTPPGNLTAEATAATAAANAIEALNRALMPYGLRVDAREICTRHRVPVLEGSVPTAELLPAAPAGGAGGQSALPKPAPMLPKAASCELPPHIIRAAHDAAQLDDEQFRDLYRRWREARDREAA